MPPLYWISPGGREYTSKGTAPTDEPEFEYLYGGQESYAPPPPSSPPGKNAPPPDISTPPAASAPTYPDRCGDRSRKGTPRMDSESTAGDTGQRLASIRKRRGYTQSGLADASGVSVSLIRKLEQGTVTDTRLETARRLAEALRVPTSALVPAGDAEDAAEDTARAWEPVRRALYGQMPQPDEPPTEEGVRRELAEVQPLLAVNQYTRVLKRLPALIRDADALGSRPVRARVLNLTAWLMTQTRQWDAAETAARLAVDASDDRLDAAASVNTACWSLLRQGRLAEARDLATREADDIEPRFSRATVRELSLWGRLLLGVTNAAVRDNRPGEAEDALSLARAAADRIGREVVSDTSTTRTFGPVSLAMIRAENAAITAQPDRVISIAKGIPPKVLHPQSASRCRHRLDVANACVMLRRYDQAVTILRELRRDAPEWLPQQRYARDILGNVITKRRTLTPEMRDLADAVRVPY
jgi:transcriptional regulator with XRE-family HTH domain